MNARLCSVLVFLCALLTACGGAVGNGGGKGSSQGGGTGGSSKGGSALMSGLPRNLPPSGRQSEPVMRRTPGVHGILGQSLNLWPWKMAVAQIASDGSGGKMAAS